jgi:hypothetical protein
MGALTQRLKGAIQRGMLSCGYEVHRATESRVRFENFSALAGSYEQRLVDSGAVIPPSPRRTKLLARLMGTPPPEAYAIIQALHRCHDVSGDVCEFGVAQGETSAVIANEIDPFDDKRLHLFDSFEGLPAPTDADRLKDDIYSLGSMEAYEGTMACPDTMVRSRLAAIGFPPERFEIHKGFIEQVLQDDQRLPTRVAFAYVDFDFYQPIKIALEFVDGLMPVGGMMIVDDYDFFSTGSKTAVDEFVAARNTHGVVYDCHIPDKRHGCFAVLTRRR